MEEESRRSEERACLFTECTRANSTVKRHCQTGALARLIHRAVSESLEKQTREEQFVCHLRHSTYLKNSCEAFPFPSSYSFLIFPPTLHLLSCGISKMTSQSRRFGPPMPCLGCLRHEIRQANRAIDRAEAAPTGGTDSQLPAALPVIWPSIKCDRTDIRRLQCDLCYAENITCSL